MLVWWIVGGWIGGTGGWIGGGKEVRKGVGAGNEKCQQHNSSKNGIG